MSEENQLAKHPRRTATLLFLCAALAAFSALRGYRDLGSHGGGNGLALTFEVFLPAALAVASLWYGFVFWRKRAA